uniref:Uncharacterized protein n=1 Tax=Arion vulgaris TaxID=1028688 RepID=A0A0B7AVG6_9EUPU
MTTLVQSVPQLMFVCVCQISMTSHPLDGLPTAKLITHCTSDCGAMEIMEFKASLGQQFSVYTR